MLNLPSDPPHDVSSLPTTIRVSATSALVDLEAVTEVCRWLLKVRGKDVRALFDLPHDAPADAVRGRIDALLAHLDTFAERALGPANAAARELRTLLETERRGLDVDHSALLAAFMATPAADPR